LECATCKRCRIWRKTQVSWHFDPALHPELGQDRHHLPKADSGKLGSSAQRCFAFLDIDTAPLQVPLYISGRRVSRSTVGMMRYRELHSLPIREGGLSAWILGPAFLRVGLFCFQKFRQRHDFDILCQRIFLFAGIHNAKLVKFQVGKGDTHGRCELWSIGALAFDTNPATVLE